VVGVLTMVFMLERVSVWMNRVDSQAVADERVWRH
jgi:hypothetical protein